LYIGNTWHNRVDQMLAAASGHLDLRIRSPRVFAQ
jgi:hypothetical protein